jgi:hypothetical protein
MKSILILVLICFFGCVSPVLIHNRIAGKFYCDPIEMSRIDGYSNGAHHFIFVVSEEGKFYKMNVDLDIFMKHETGDLIFYLHNWQGRMYVDMEGVDYGEKR